MQENANQMQEKVSNAITSEDAAKVVQEFERIIKNRKSNIIWLAYHQGQIFQMFKEKEQFVSMVSKFGVSKSTRVLNIALVKLHNNYSKIKKTSLSLHYFTKYFNKIREICKENASESKYIIKMCLNSLAFPLNNFMAQIPNVRFSIF